MHTKQSEEIMRTLTPHIPSFADIDPIPSETFETIAELINLDFVKRFSGSAIALSGNNLMSITECGKMWLVIGRIDNVNGLNIPKWEAHKMPTQIITIEKG